MITVRKSPYLLPRWATFLLLLPPLAAAGALLFIADGKDRLTSGPLVTLALYGMLILFLNRTTTVLRPEGFALTFGPMPAGRWKREFDRRRVRAVFRRYLYAGHKDPMPDRFYASVELDDGRWVNVFGPYPEIETANESIRLMAETWGWTAPVEPRQGMPARRDWSPVWHLVLWTAAFVAALLWAAYVEVAVS